jgi:hypothetical protein
VIEVAGGKKVLVGCGVAVDVLALNVDDSVIKKLLVDGGPELGPTSFCVLVRGWDVVSGTVVSEKPAVVVAY